MTLHGTPPISNKLLAASETKGLPQGVGIVPGNRLMGGSPVAPQAGPDNLLTRAALSAGQPMQPPAPPPPSPEQIEQQLQRLEYFRQAYTTLLQRTGAVTMDDLITLFGRAVADGMATALDATQIMGQLPYATGNPAQDTAAIRQWLIAQDISMAAQIDRLSALVPQRGAAQMRAMGQSLRGMKLGSAQRDEERQRSEYFADALGTLLQKPGPISMQDVNGMVGNAMRDGKAPADRAARFMAHLPPDPSRFREAILNARKRHIMIAAHLSQPERAA